LSKKYFHEKLGSRHNEQPTILIRKEYNGKIYVKNIRKIHVGSEKSFRIHNNGIYPGFWTLHSGSIVSKAPDLGSWSAEKNLGIFNPQNRNVYPGSRIWIFSTPDPGVKKAPDL
jgi:hypothetical protein